MKRKGLIMVISAIAVVLILIAAFFVVKGFTAAETDQPVMAEAPGNENESDANNEADNQADDEAGEEAANQSDTEKEANADAEVSVVSAEANRPFPQHDALGQYETPPLLPQGMTQEEVDEKIREMFREILRNDLIVDANGPQDKDGFRMVIRHSLGWELSEGMMDWCHINVSESQGYGMLMMVYLAGSENQLGLSGEEWIFGSTGLKDYYNAMLRTVMEYPSVTGNRLFAWELNGYREDATKPFGYAVENGVKLAPFSRPEDSDSATDGDMDIIYSLLLADKQWGSDGTYDYLTIARGMLADLWSYCVHDTYKTLLLGDWAKGSDDPGLASATRPSDFILDHLKAYQIADPDHDWQAVIDATYEVIREISAAEQAADHNLGLLPDFVVRKADDSGWEVAPTDLLEGTDDAFAYNACRVPWRLGTDYLLYGDTETEDFSLYEDILVPLNAFAKEKGVENLGPVELDGFGGESGRFDWTEPDLFAAPFLPVSVAAADQEMIDSFYGGWTTWKNMGEDDWQPFEVGMATYDGDTYGDYIQLLVMLTASGNWWVPEE